MSSRPSEAQLLGAMEQCLGGLQHSPILAAKLTKKLSLRCRAFLQQIPPVQQTPPPEA
jgi:hypothetical protein